LTPGRSGRNAEGVRHPEFLPLFATALAIEVAHLRWVLLTQWKCRSCGVRHLDCGCKPAWLRMLL
jgi:hypothetical protein